MYADLHIARLLSVIDICDWFLVNFETGKQNMSYQPIVREVHMNLNLLSGFMPLTQAMRLSIFSRLPR